VPDVEAVAGDYRADVLDGSVGSAWVRHPIARAEAEDFHLHQRHVGSAFVPDAGSVLLHGHMDNLVVLWQLHGLIVADVELRLEDCSHCRIPFKLFIRFSFLKIRAGLRLSCNPALVLFTLFNFASIFTVFKIFAMENTCFRCHCSVLLHSSITGS